MERYRETAIDRESKHVNKRSINAVVEHRTVRHSMIAPVTSSLDKIHQCLGGAFLLAAVSISISSSAMFACVVCLSK